MPCLLLSVYFLSAHSFFGSLSCKRACLFWALLDLSYLDILKTSTANCRENSLDNLDMHPCKAVVKNNPMKKNCPIKKAEGQGFLNLSRISFISGSERKTTARLSFRAWVKGTVCPSRALEYCPFRLSSAESFCGVL